MNLCLDDVISVKGQGTVLYWLLFCGVGVLFTLAFSSEANLGILEKKRR